MAHSLHGSDGTDVTGFPQQAGMHGSLPVGMDWLLQGVLESEVGINTVLTSSEEAIPGLGDALARHEAQLNESGVTVENADSDVIAAGLLRAGLIAGRKVVCIVGIRGLRRAMDAIYEASRVAPAPSAAGVIVIAEPKWYRAPSSSVTRGPHAVSAPGSHSSAVSLHPDQDPAGLAGPIHDSRQLAAYLGLPVVAPSDCREIRRYVNDALRLSKAEHTLVAMLVPPLLMGVGDSELGPDDPTLRSIPVRHEASSRFGDESPIHVEARKRQLDRIMNVPGPGEVVPVGIITFGTAHTSVRHALALLGLTGRIPILKLGLANPIDARSAEHLLLRCRHVIVVESGQALVEREVILVARDLTRAGIDSARVHGKYIPVNLLDTEPAESQQRGTRAPASHVYLPSTFVELHPSFLAATLATVLNPMKGVDGLTVQQRAQDGESQLGLAVSTRQSLTAKAGRDSESAALQALGSDATRSGGSSLVDTLLRLTVREIAEELAVPAAERPALSVCLETLEETTLEQPAPRRVIIGIERRRLLSIGRAAITHAIRRRVPLTFLITPDPAGSLPDGPASLTTAEAERVIRSLIGDDEASFVIVARLDPSDGTSFRQSLKREVLRDRVSIIIIDLDQHRQPQPVAGDPREWAERGYAPAEYWVRPSSRDARLCYEWLVKRGWSDPSWLDGVHAPKFELPNQDDPLVTPLDGWEGFEELRVDRRQPPAEMASWLSRVQLVEPAPRHGQEPCWRVHVCGQTGDAYELTLTLLEQAGRRMGFRVQMVRGIDQAGLFAQMVFSRPRPEDVPSPETARIPYGSADLVIAFDLPSIVNAVDPAGPHCVASPHRTYLVMDASPPLSMAVENEQPVTRPVIPGALSWLIPPTHRTVLRAGELSDRFINTRRFIGVMLSGVAFQQGLIPVTSDRIERATQRLPGDPLRQAPVAMRLGRSLSGRVSAGLAVRERRSAKPEALVRLHRQIMAARPYPGATKRADGFARLALGTLDAVTGLRRRDANRTAELRFVARLIDCEYWGGLRACRAYADRVRSVYAAERSVSDYPVTKLVIEQLARAMLIPDVVFCCSTAVRPDRLRDIERRLRASRANGDRVTFRIRGRARSTPIQRTIGGYWKMTPTLCKAVALARWVRLVPGWMQEESRYRRWVIDLTDRCAQELPEKASLWLEVMRQLSRVQGHGSHRVRSVRAARRAIDSVLELAAESAVATGPQPASGVSASGNPVPARGSKNAAGE